MTGMTQNEFLIIIRWTIYDLARWYRCHSMNQAMLFKRALQEQLSVYARHNKYDRVQGKALAIIQKLEKWTRRDFVKDETARIIRGNPGLALYPSTVKAMARAEYQKFNKAVSY